jgi:sugar phosphate isomerase/epimerase
MKISILSYSFRGLLDAGLIDLFGYLEACRYRYDLGAADLWSGMFASLDEDYVTKIDQALKEKELMLADIAVDGAHLWEDDPAVREQHHQRAQRFLEIAATLGAKFVRIDAGGSRETMEWTSEQFDFIAERYRQYAQYAHDHGFKVGMENHWGPEKVYGNLKAMYDAVDHPGFGVCCHLWSWAGSQADQADALIAPLVSHTHCAYYLCEGPLMSKLAPLVEAGYDGYFSVEHHSGRHEFAEIAVQVAKMRDALAKLQNGLREADWLTELHRQEGELLKAKLLEGERRAV